MHNDTRNQQTQAHNGPYPGAPLTRQSGPEVITEPTMLGKAEELLKHIDGLEREHARLRGNLCGMAECDTNTAQGVPSTIEGMLSYACQRVAGLVGDAATLNGRIG